MIEHSSHRELTGHRFDRYERDGTPPSVVQALLDLLLRVILPGAVLLGVIVLLGKLILGDEISREEGIVNTQLQQRRTGPLNMLTDIGSHLGNTEIVIGCCVLVVAVTYWAVRQWWVAAIPAIAVATQASVFVAATALANRPRPKVSHLDPAPPTSSYPSGHMGAATALWAIVFVLAGRIENHALRIAIRVLCVVSPLAVGSARLYRGMHHPLDVAVGLGNGLACAALAWFWLRRERRSRDELHPEGRERATA